jgi:protocatechuate 4,5-dioxygenase beta chain
MAEIVAGFGVPHTPFFPQLVAREGPQCETAKLFRAVEAHLSAVKPDVLVIFDSDHLNTFFFNNLPVFCIGATDRTEGPSDNPPAMPHYVVPVSEALAHHLRVRGIADGFDLAMTQEFQVDHSVLVPLHFLTPAMHVPIVPVFINGIAPPLPLTRRCFALGQAVRRAIEAWRGPERVAVLASGSFSLEVAGPNVPADDEADRPGVFRVAGVPDPAWADSVLSCLSRSATNELLEQATQERMLAAGNVAGELLNWVALLGVVGERRPNFLEPQRDHGHAYGVWRWD